MTDLPRSIATTLSLEDTLSGQAIYQACIREARRSDCAKAKFGAVLVADHPQVSGWCALAAHNHRIPPLAHLCEPTCIRLNIPSRMDGLVGACVHAEETVLWEAAHLRFDLSIAQLYVAGLDKDGEPWPSKDDMPWTCLRCAIAMWHAGLRNVSVPMLSYAPDEPPGFAWQCISVEQALRDAADFATGKAIAE